jgi:hypothetical protein
MCTSGKILEETLGKTFIFGASSTFFLDFPRLYFLLADFLPLSTSSSYYLKI